MLQKGNEMPEKKKRDEWTLMLYTTAAGLCSTMSRQCKNALNVTDFGRFSGLEALRPTSL